MAIQQVKTVIVNIVAITLGVCVFEPLAAQEPTRLPIWERRPYQCEVLFKVDAEDLLEEGSLQGLSQRVPKILSAQFGQALSFRVNKLPTTSPSVQKWMNDQASLETLCKTTARDLNLFLPTDRRSEKYFVVAVLAKRLIPLVCVWEWDRWVDDWSPLVVRPFTNDTLELKTVEAISASFRPQAKMVRVSKQEVKIRIRASNLPYRLAGNQPLTQGRTGKIFLDGKPVPNAWMIVTERTDQISSANVEGELEFASDSESDIRTLQISPGHYRSDVRLLYKDNDQPGSRLFVELLDVKTNMRLWSGRSDAAGRINIPRTSTPLARMIVSWDGITLHDKIMMPCLQAIETVTLDVDESDMVAIGELADLTSMLTVLEAEQQVVAERTVAAEKANDSSKVQEIAKVWKGKKQRALDRIKTNAGKFKSSRLATSDNDVVKKNWAIFRDRWQSLQTNAIKARSKTKSN